MLELRIKYRCSAHSNRSDWSKAIKKEREGKTQIWPNLVSFQSLFKTQYTFFTVFVEISPPLLTNRYNMLIGITVLCFHYFSSSLSCGKKTHKPPPPQVFSLYTQYTNTDMLLFIRTSTCKKWDVGCFWSSK
jgi:hypothetical protein